MEFKTEAKTFAAAFKNAMRYVGSRVTLPALSGVKITADAETATVTLEATDLDGGTRQTLPASVEQGGAVLLPAQLVSKMVARYPDAPLTVVSDGDRVQFKAGRAQANLRCMAVEDFPALAFDEAETSFEINARALQVAVNQVASAASNDEGRPVLTGVHVDVAPDGVEFASTDSYRLAVRKLTIDSDGQPIKALIPAVSFTKAVKDLPADEAVQVSIGSGQTIVRTTSDVSSIRHLEGAFPNYPALMPDTDEGTQILVDRDELIDAVNRVSVVAMGQANTPICLKFTDNQVELAASNQELGDSMETLAATVEGEEVTIAFNPGFLLAGLASIGTEQVRFAVRDGLKPALLLPEGDGAEELTYLLMPMRVS